MRQCLRQYGQLICLCIISLILTACMSVRANLQAAGNVNPDIHNVPSPIALQIDVLSSKILFNQADFLPLFFATRHTLGQTLLSSRTYTLAPGQHTTVSIHLPKGARYLGLVAGYRAIRTVMWRQILPVHSKFFNEDMVIKLNRSGLQVVRQMLI